MTSTILKRVAILSLISVLASCSSVQMISRTFDTEKFSPDDVANLTDEESLALPDEPIDENTIMAEATQEAIEVPVASRSRGLFNPFRRSERSAEATNLVELDEATTSFELEYAQAHFETWKKYFTERGKDRFERQLNRGEDYRDYIAKVMTDHGLPKELFYVGLIESGYALQARSHASAVGPWQFIRGTATRYGMRVIPGLDERTNLHKSTIGAARYFQDLYNIFGSWELALSAYNAGEYRVINAIRRGNTRNFKELAEKGLLPRETIAYVPKVAAARYLSENREKYNFKAARRSNSSITDAQLITVDGRFSLQEIAREIKANHQELVALNPDIQHQVIQAPRQGHQLVVPARANIAGLERLRMNTAPQAPAGVIAQRQSPATGTGTYHVRRGDNLSKIAQSHSTTVAQLRSLNGLRGSRILVGQVLRVPSALGTHIVRSGENLTRIARTHGTTVQELRNLNNLRGTRIIAGQTLRVPASAGPQVQSYRVRRGDNLSTIARRFNTTVAELKRLNSLTNSRIYPNQNIAVPSQES
jgi:membrane-bound lytic murein transglycosylase D